ncbi:MAG TPA: response regulator [Lysobacter sp.]|nr:response regulator [Lysobacter sp.]
MAASLSPIDALAEAAAVAERKPPQRPVNVLLVDDQPSRLLTYRTILEPLGERLVDASSGTEALKRLMEEEFAVILLDVNMPGMDGFETASMIHQHPRFQKTPIIFITAVNLTDLDRLRGYELGAVDYVMVPIIPEILRSKVEVLSELHRKRREAQALAQELEEANRALLADKARELQALNESLRRANTELAARNGELQIEIAERRKAEARLREADERKNEFLATLAHELRNPLAPLQNALSIRRLQLGEAKDPLQDTMERQLGLLVRMVDDLLDVSRVTRGKMVLRRTLTPLHTAVECAVDTAQPLIGARGHQLEIQLPSQPVQLYADPARLSQIFANLLNNAAKYSEPGARIQLRAERQGDTVAVRVVDHGIGLAPEDLAIVFDPFRQVDTRATRAHGGLGIGLTLAQRLARLHGGRIEAHSDGPGRGCTFTVTLPVGEGIVADDRLPPAPIPQAERPARVLVVDDNRDAADTLAAMIRILGHEVDCVYDPHEVEAAVERFAPVLVFLDLGMPHRSGYEVARALRAGPGGGALQLVAVTGWGQPEDHRRSQEAGFDEHLVKPPDLASIRRLCASAAPAAGG